MSKKTAIIICDHGLGHVRRCMLLALRRKRLNEDITIFAPKILIKKIVLSSGLKLKNINIYNFSTKTNPKKFSSSLSAIINWLNRLPNLSKYDYIICDNLVEILSVYPKTVLSAQFFWHDVIKDASKEYKSFCNRLLSKYKPSVLGCKIFSMKKIKNLPKFKPVKLYQNPKLQNFTKRNSFKNQKDLLITGGSTKILNKKMKKIIKFFLIKKPSQFRYVHVDQQLMPNNNPGWFLKADYSIKMYSNIKAAICRPGLGVLMDLLTVDAKIYPIYENNNYEMLHNAKIIKKFYKKNFLNNINKFFFDNKINKT